MDNHVKDVVGGANMYNGYNVEFIKDRFGNPNSALRFSDGFYQVPTGVYFKGDFTISVWFNLNVNIANTKILDFSTGPYADSVVLTATYYNYKEANVYISFYDMYSSFTSGLAFIKGQWTHLAVTLRGTTGSVYINGILASQASNVLIPRNVNRTSNFIGKSSFDDPNLWSDLDDLRIYDRALCQSEIYDLIYYTSTPTYVSNTSTTTVSTIKPASTTSKPPISSQTRYLNGLVNYWPIDNHVNDTVSKANMYNGVNVEFVEDRFKIPNSAIRFSGGSYQIKPGVYFNGDFTISVWVRIINSLVQRGRIFDFTNDATGDNVYLLSSFENTNSPSLYSVVRNSESMVTSNLSFVYGQWTHLVATLSGTTGSIYLNGMLAAQSNNMLSPRNVNRTSNYIGRDFSGQVSLWADLDDLRIYNKSMNQSDVYNLFIEAPFNYEFYQSKFV